MGKPPKHKGPSFNEHVRDLKKKPAAAVDPDNWREQTPNWRFSMCDLEGCAWSWNQLTGATLVQILTRLKEHEARQWKELLLDKTNGSIEVARIAGEAQARLEERFAGQVDELYKLRIDGPGRVWGVRQGRTFFIVWWDEEHKVYPMNIANN